MSMLETGKRKSTYSPHRTPGGGAVKNSTVYPCLPGASRPRGSILILTIGVVIFLTGLALVFSRQMRVEALASSNQVAAVQAEGVVRGAAQHVLNQLINNTDQTTLDTDIQSQQVGVGDGMFWLVRPNPDDERQYAYGIIDESSKLNINTATVDMLQALPGMTPELAASIVDWRDADDNVTDGGGAESDYYLQLPEPYTCKNANFDTLDELLLVKGATRDLLYGVDANRNGVVDSNEAAGTGPLAGLNGQMQCGLCKYLTVYSAEPNVSATGKKRLFVGDNSRATLNSLATMLAKFLSTARAGDVVRKLSGSGPCRNVLDFYVKSGLTLDEFKQIADLITTDRAAIRTGLINVNTAPKEVLSCLPGLEAADADLLIAQRSSNGPELTTIAWVAQALTKQKAVQIGGLITTHSSQFSADIVGVCGNGRCYKRAKYVFDLRYTPARIVFRKDTTGLGWPLSLDTLQALRSGALKPVAANGGGALMEKE